MIDQRSSITAPADVVGNRGAVASSAFGSFRSRVWAAVRTATVEHKFLALLLVLFLAKGVAISFIHAPYSGHDEVAHYAYLQTVAEQHRVPVLPELESWRAAYLDDKSYIHDRMPPEFWQYCRFTTRDWSPGCGEYTDPVYAMTLGGLYFPTGWIYTANHPPLYYLVMTPLFWLTDNLSIDGQLYALRLAAIPFGL
nr:hypothetical protein [Chloroflexia bacterium]